LVAFLLYESFWSDTFILFVVHSVILRFVYPKKACLENQEMKPGEGVGLLKL